MSDFTGIIHTTESLFDSGADCLVNTVNCYGIMGKGIAKEFKKRFPKMYNYYNNYCKYHAAAPGDILYWVAPEVKIVNFFTKNSWREPSKLEWIEEGLKKFVLSYHKHQISSVAFPELGCGNGGLSPSDVIPLMERYLDLPIKVTIHHYS